MLDPVFFFFEISGLARVAQISSHCLISQEDELNEFNHTCAAKAKINIYLQSLFVMQIKEPLDEINFCWIILGTIKPGFNSFSVGYVDKYTGWLIREVQN